jgi:hypothetical protein
LVDVNAFFNFPSSTVIELAVTGTVVVTVKVPVASVPAEKKTSSVFVKSVGAAVPAELDVQFVVVISQLPVGVAPPAPAVAPLMSQYFIFAIAGAQNAATVNRVNKAFFMQNNLQWSTDFPPTTEQCAKFAHSDGPTLNIILVLGPSTINL